MPPPAAGTPAGPARRPLVAFFLTAYALSWLFEIPLALQAQGIVGFGLPRWTHYLAQFGPMSAALIVTGLLGGRAAVGALLRRIVAWRVGLRWLLVALSPVGLFAVGLVVARVVDGSWPSLRGLGEVNFLPYLGPGALLLWLVTNGLGEEIGWRGFALPWLQRRHAPLGATLLLWAGWAAWHVPAFFYLPTYRDMGVVFVLPFVLGILAGAILLTWLFNGANGSLLPVIIWHGLFNFFTASAAGSGTVATTISILVMVWAVALVLLRPAGLSPRGKVVAAAAAPRSTST